MSVGTLPPRTEQVTEEPRLAARRAQVARHRARRRLRRLVAALVLLLMSGAGVWLTQSSVLDVDRRVVSNTAHYDAAQLRRTSAIRLGDPLLGLHARRAEARLERLPWIRSARVEREWPATVRIVLTERTAAAVVPAQPDGWFLVDRTGRLLERVDTPGSLPQVTGVRREKTAGHAVAASTSVPLQYALALPRSLRGSVREVHAEHGEVWLLWNDGGRFRLGDGTRIEEKLAAVRTVATRVDLTCLDVADVRVPSAPVLTRLETCE